MERDTRIFSTENYKVVVEESVREINKLATLKGGEYSGDTDRLRNFRRNAERLGLDYRQVWGVYAGKHWDAITQYITDVGVGKQRPRLESLEGRVDDLMVYLTLFKCMLIESEQQEEAAKELTGDHK